MDNSGNKKPDVPAWLVSSVLAIIVLIVIGVLLPIIIWLFRWAFGTVF